MISERTKMLGSLDAVHTHTHTHTNILTKRIGGQSGKKLFIQRGNFLHYKVI